MPVPKRNEVAAESTWDLTPIFADDEAWTAEWEAVNALLPKVSAFEGKLTENSASLLAWFQLSDELSLRLNKVYGYASLKSDEDTANSTYQVMKGKAMSLLVAISGVAAFAGPELMQPSDEDLEALIQAEPELEVYRRSLQLIRRAKAHTLSAEGECLLAGAGEMAESPDHIRSTLCNAELHFPDVTDAEGHSFPLTGGSFVPLLESPDSTFRYRVYETYYQRLGEVKNTIAATLDAQFKQLSFFAKARRHDSTLGAALFGTEVPEAVYHNLINAVHANFEPMYRYVALRKKLLGVEELRMSDVYVPIVANAAAKIPYEKAQDTVLKALAVLGEDYTTVLKRAFAERWIDVYENEGKRGGAYSSSVAVPHPYILLNYKENLDSQFTLAHELGHTMHSYLSVQNQPVSTSEYVIFVAEVASTVNEVLLMKYLLARTEDKKQRAYLVNHFLDSFKGTVYRQTMFAEFEREMGRMNGAGETLTADALSAKYKELNQLYFGPDMITDDYIALEWARIPHFFYNYYVFQYATGFSAAVALANKILAEGAPAVAQYKKFLSGGGSTDPISLLKIAGVDMSSPEPITSALKLFGKLVDEMEQLMA